jgi:hypothetical protein
MSQEARMRVLRLSLMLGLSVWAAIAFAVAQTSAGKADDDGFSF